MVAGAGPKGTTDAIGHGVRVLETRAPPGNHTAKVVGAHNGIDEVTCVAVAEDGRSEASDGILPFE